MSGDYWIYCYKTDTACWKLYQLPITMFYLRNWCSLFCNILLSTKGYCCLLFPVSQKINQAMIKKLELCVKTRISLSRLKIVWKIKDCSKIRMHASCVQSGVLPTMDGQVWHAPWSRPATRQLSGKVLTGRTSVAPGTRSWFTPLRRPWTPSPKPRVTPHPHLTETTDTSVCDILTAHISFPNQLVSD